MEEERSAALNRRQLPSSEPRHNAAEQQAKSQEHQAKSQQAMQKLSLLRRLQRLPGLKKPALRSRSSSCSKQSKHRRNGQGKAKPRRFEPMPKQLTMRILWLKRRVPRKRSLMQPDGPRKLGSKLRQRLCLQLKLNSPQLERSGSQQKPELQLKSGLKEKRVLQQKPRRLKKRVLQMKPRRLAKHALQLKPRQQKRRALQQKPMRLRTATCNWSPCSRRGAPCSRSQAGSRNAPYS